MSDMPTKTETISADILTPVSSSNSVALKPMTLQEVEVVGKSATNQLANVTDKITNEAKTSDMDELGDLLSSTLLAAQGYDPNKLFGGGIFGFLKGMKAKAKQAAIKFDDVDSNVNKLVSQIDNRILKFRSRVSDLNDLRDAIEKSSEQMGYEIVEINARADWMEQNIPEVDPEVPFSAEKRQDWISVISFARLRASNLRRSQVLAEMQMAQIGLMQKNSISLAAKFGEIKETTVPNMKTTFTLYVLNMEQKKGAEFADQIGSMNDQVLKRNAEMLGQNTTAINTSLARSNISIEALEANQQAIVNSLAEVDRIRSEMKARLISEAPRIEQLSRELSATMAKK